MKYLIISPLALSLFIVPRLNEISEVEKIYFCYPKLDDKSLGKDLNTISDYSKLEMITDYNYALNQSTKEELIIFIDDVSMGETGTQLTKQGYKVIGGRQITDKIEVDRQFATDLMSRIMKVPESASFTSWDRAIEFVKNNEPEDRLVFKPNDADVPKEYTYVSKDIEDMVSAMKQFKEEWKWKEDFQIQRFVKGIEVDFSAYFNGKDFLPDSMMIYFENKPFMNEDIGPATGGSIAVEFAKSIEGEFGDILNKLKPLLAKAGYKGQLAVNCIVSEEDHKPYFLEFCGRVGYPSFPIDILLVEAKGHTLHELFKALANEETPSLFAKDRMSAIVAVSVPPFPSKSGAEVLKGQPMDWDRKYNDYFFPSFIMAKDRQIVLSGTSGECMYVTCEDRTLDGAVSMLYDTYMPTLKLKNKMYRTDLGVSAKKRIKTLHEWGLI